ncbi:MAG: TRAP transporter small permease subunit [Oscillibacter sp.]|jgi:TRAP-type C4-dicarboxylate transport system permease small subunit|nr:TRAP transporter small permease subunit [Oscillibacter sp.]
MRKLAEILQKISNGIFIVEKWTLVVAVVVMVSVNFINVCMRYLAKTSLPFCETLSIVLFMFMVLIGGNLAVKSDSEIKIEIFKFKNPKKEAAYKLFGDVVSIIAIVLVLIGAIKMFQSAYGLPEQVIPLPICTYHEYLIMAIGLIMILLDHSIQLLKRLACLTGRADAMTKEVTSE